MLICLYQFSLSYNINIQHLLWLGLQYLLFGNFCWNSRCWRFLPPKSFTYLLELLPPFYVSGCLFLVPSDPLSCSLLLRYPLPSFYMA